MPRFVFSDTRVPGGRIIKDTQTTQNRFSIQLRSGFEVREDCGKLLGTKVRNVKSIQGYWWRVEKELLTGRGHLQRQQFSTQQLMSKLDESRVTSP